LPEKINISFGAQIFKLLFTKAIPASPIITKIAIPIPNIVFLLSQINPTLNKVNLIPKSQDKSGCRITMSNYTLD
jgi:hypothetical protein